MASSKWSRLMAETESGSSASTAALTAFLAARWQISAMSAPEKPAVASASCARSTSGSTGALRSAALKTCFLDSTSGRGMWTSWSRRPGRVTAGSKMSGRLVAPTTKTFLEPTASISAKIWFMTRSPASDPDALAERAFAMESISSKNNTHGAAARALSKSDRTLASDWPNHIVKSSGPFTEMKLAPHSFATAFAISVFPQPGGP
mmetsp:Transcript_26322/g.80952  ORF Transcript_26322/g.80952 Transcript_26322/m.80952 type:complete len:205 (-) Transcript_26322:50-664(-)